MRGLRFLLIEMRKRNILITSFMIWLYQDAFCSGYTQQVCLGNLFSTCQICIFVFLRWFVCLVATSTFGKIYLLIQSSSFEILVEGGSSFWINHILLSGSDESTFRNGTFRFICYLDRFQIAYCSCTQIQSLSQSFGNFKESLEPWFALSMSVW